MTYYKGADKSSGLTVTKQVRIGLNPKYKEQGAGLEGSGVEAAAAWRPQECARERLCRQCGELRVFRVQPSA